MSDTPAPTAAEMRAALAAESRARAEACEAEINAALKRHNCTLHIEPYIERGTIAARAQVVPLDAP